MNFNKIGNNISTHAKKKVTSQISNLYKYNKNSLITLGKRKSAISIVKDLTDEEVTREDKSELILALKDIDITASANGGIPSIENTENGKALVKFATFNEDCTRFTVPNISEDDLLARELELYELAKRLESKQPNERTAWHKFMKRNNLNYNINYDLNYSDEIIKYIGNKAELENLNKHKIDIKLLNDKLPHEVFICSYFDIPYIVIASEFEDLNIVYLLSYIDPEIMPIFIVKDKSQKFPAWLPKELAFNGLDLIYCNDFGYFVNIICPRTYCIMIRIGTYQRYKKIDTFKYKDFRISTTFHDNFEEELEYDILNFFNDKKDLDILLFIQEDLRYKSNPRATKLARTLDDLIKSFS